jgi:hypothetical protein
MKLSALGVDEKLRLATSSQIEHHTRRRLRRMGRMKLCVVRKARNEFWRLRRRRAGKLSALGDGV